ncbi:MAG: ABC transporter ATP-binding protein [Clostridia bacterium]
MADNKDVVSENKQFDSSKVILSVKDLSIWFELKKFGFGHAGYVRAVDGVTFDLHEQEAIAIVGESGCGKTSLMKTILGLYVPVKGSIEYLGEDIKNFKKAKRKWYHSQVGYVQQDPYGAIAPFMTIKRILDEPLIINGIKNPKEREERIRKVMEEVSLTPIEDYLEKYPHMLSGGQQQRVVIARAMILQQRLMVADEPVSMLDASVRVEVLNLLEGLKDSHGLSVIYITHDLSTVRYFSKRIFVMYAGILVEKANVNDIIYGCKHPYTDALLTATSEPDAQNAKVYKAIPEGEPPSLIHPPKGCRYFDRCPKRIKGLCDTEIPPEFEIGPNHTVTCWLYRDGCKI